MNNMAKTNTKKQRRATKKPSIAKPQGRGFEDGVDREDIIIPRVKLLQALSPEVQAGIKPQGVFINSITQEEVEPVFIPLFKFKNWIKFNPRDKRDPNFNPDFEPGAIIWRTDDPNDPRIAEAKFGPNGELPTATTFLNFFCLFSTPSMDFKPTILSFSKTSYKAGKKLLTLSLMAGGDMFSRKYELSSNKTKNDIGEFYVMEVSPAGKVSDEEYAAAEMAYNMYRGKKIEVHDDLSDIDVEVQATPASRERA